MLDARHHFLPDIAALFEIDAAELVHVGFVREGVAIDEIHAAARHAERDAVRVVGIRVGQRGAEIGGGLSGELRRQNRAGAERGQARIGIGKAVFAQGRAVPDRHHAERRRQVLGRDLGAQLVEIELFHERGGKRARAIEKEAAAVVGHGLGDDEIHDDLALRREQRGKARLAGGDFGRYRWWRAR